MFTFNCSSIKYFFQDGSCIVYADIKQKDISYIRWKEENTDDWKYVRISDKGEFILGVCKKNSKLYIQIEKDKKWEQIELCETCSMEDDICAKLFSKKIKKRHIVDDLWQIESELKKDNWLHYHDGQFYNIEKIDIITKTDNYKNITPAKLDGWVMNKKEKEHITIVISLTQDGVKANKITCELIV